jgi:hypothetical protein
LGFFRKFKFSMTISASNNDKTPGVSAALKTDFTGLAFSLLKSATASLKLENSPKFDFEGAPPEISLFQINQYTGSKQLLGERGLGVSSERETFYPEYSSRHATLSNPLS